MGKPTKGNAKRQQNVKAKPRQSAPMVMKSKHISLVAQGKRAKILVYSGKCARTRGGLTRADLVRNKRGQIVSRRKHEIGKRRYVNIQRWTASLMAARQLLELEKFVAVNGRTVEGKRLYTKTKSLWSLTRSVGAGGASSTADAKEPASVKPEVKAEP